MAEMKTCSKCGETKPATREYWHFSGDRPRSQCRACYLANDKARYRAKHPKKVKVERSDGMKTCTKCGRTMPLTAEFFQPYPKMTCGFRNQCRACVNARRNEWHQENRPQTIRERHEASPSPTKVCTKCGETKPRTAEFFPPDPLMIDGFRNECKACRVAYRVQNRAENPDRDRATGRRAFQKYIENHREEYRAYMREYWQRNRDHLNAKGREYSKKYSADYYREKSMRRRGREIAAGGTCTTADIAQMHEEQQGRCYYCGEEYGERYEVDHFIPVISGGDSGPENLVTACRFCNRSKGGKMPWEFMPERFAPPSERDSEPSSEG